MSTPPGFVSPVAAPLAGGGGGGGKVWIPVDVKLHWFSFLSVPDLARAARTCRSWMSLVQKSVDAQIVSTIAAQPPPTLTRAARTRFLHRLNNAGAPEHMGYLLAWAAGCREYTPFLHKLLLLRDAIREQLGLPGGLHEPARPDAFEELDESVKALWVYKIGSPPAPGSMAATLATGGASAGVDFVQVPPLIVAAARGNVDAVHLLLLFGEGVYERRKTNDRALYVACEQGNIGVVAVLLGRVPLRPPKYPQHIAERLGLIRPVWPVYAPGRVYAPGVAVGPHNLPAVLAATKIRAHLASATGMATEQGPRASATAAASNPSEQARMGARVSATSVAHAGVGVNGGEAAHMSTVEAQVAQQQQYENDGRYRSWCRGYHMGTYWYLYDTALANYEYIHGRIGDTQKVSNAAAAAGASSGGVSMPRPAPLLTLKNAAARSLYAAARIRLTLHNVSAYLDARLAPGSIPIPMDARSASPKITQAFLVQGALMDRLPPTVAFVQASRVRKRGIIHPRIQDVVDYGSVAAEAIAVKVRINVGPVEGRTPLHVACERGRAEIVYLLLSHNNPAAAAAAVVPDLPQRAPAPGAAIQAPDAAAAGGVAAGGAAAGGAPPAAGGGVAAAAGGAPPAAGGAPAAAGGAAAGVAVVQTAPPPIAANAAQAALVSIASASGASLAASPEAVAFASPARREEVLQELLQERRDAVDVDACPPGAFTPLCLACERGDDRIAAVLLHWGADVNKQGRKDAPPLLVAGMAGHEHITRLLLRTCCNIDEAKAVMAALVDLAALRGEVLEESDWQVAPFELTPFATRRRRAIQSAPASSPNHMSPGGSHGEDADAGVSADDPMAALGFSAAAAVRSTAERSRSRARAGGGGGGGGGGVASAAGGGIIASQTGRDGRRNRVYRKPEETVLDVCEPMVVQTLASAAATEAASAVGEDMAGMLQANASLPLGVTPTMYLPFEEAALSSAPTGGYPYRGGAGAGGLRRAVSSSAGISGRGASFGRGSGLAPNPDGASATFGFGAGFESLDVDAATGQLRVHSSTSASYLEQAQELAAQRTELRRAINTLLSKSRICGGVGVIPGRPVLDLNAGDESGYTALYVAASSGRLDSVVMLIAAGADTSLATKRGKTPIYGAVEKCHVEVVAHLLPKYTAVQLRANTTYGTNVMHAANKAGNNRIKDMLQEYCTEWDAKEARRLRKAQAAKRMTGDANREVTAEEEKARQAAYMKKMSGVKTEEDSELAALVAPDVSSQMDRLRRMAEAARKREEEMEARRRERTHAGEEEEPSRGRSLVPVRARTFDGLGSPYEASPVASHATAATATAAAPSSTGTRSVSRPRGHTGDASTSKRSDNKSARGTSVDATKRAHSATATSVGGGASRSLKRGAAVDDADFDVETELNSIPTTSTLAQRVLGSTAPAGTVAAGTVAVASSGKTSSAATGILSHVRSMSQKGGASVATSEAAPPAAGSVPRLVRSPLTVPSSTVLAPGSELGEGGGDGTDSPYAFAPAGTTAAAAAATGTTVSKRSGAASAPPTSVAASANAPRTTIVVSHTLGKPPKPAAVGGGTAAEAAAGNAASTDAGSGVASASGITGSSSSFFERLSSKAKEAEQKRQQMLQEAEAALRARVAIKARPVPRYVLNAQSSSGAPTTEAGGDVNATDAGSRGALLAATDRKADFSYKEADSDVDSDRGAASRLAGGGGSVVAAASSGGAASRPSSADLDTSFSSMDKPRTAKYGVASLSEIRADARQQVRSPPKSAYATLGVAGAAAAAASVATSGATMGNVTLSEEELRARRAAFYAKLAGRATVGSASTGDAPAAGDMPDASASAAAAASSSLSGMAVTAAQPSPAPRPRVAAADADLAELRRLVREKTSPQGGRSVAAVAADQALHTAAPTLASLLYGSEAGAGHASPFDARRAGGSSRTQSAGPAAPVAGGGGGGSGGGGTSLATSPLHGFSMQLQAGRPPPPQANYAFSAPPSESVGFTMPRASAAPVGMLAAREVYADDSSAAATHALPGTVVTTKPRSSGGADASSGARKPPSAKAAALSAALAPPTAATPQFGVVGGAFGSFGTISGGGGGGGGGPVLGVFGSALSESRPQPTLSREEVAAREQRNQMRELQRQLRMAAFREEEERRAAEAATAAATARPAAGGNTLVLAAQAYGMGKKKKPKA